MQFCSHLLRRPGRLTSIVLFLACLGSWIVAPPVVRAEGGSLVIPAWSFARGNARIYADPSQYADAGPVVGSGPREAWGWIVEYDVDIPVTAKYTLQICYASTDARPLDVCIDDGDPNDCCMGVTFAPAAAGREAGLTSNSSGARWEGLYKRGSLSLQQTELDKGIHTIRLVRRGKLPHIFALRLDTPTEFPDDYKPPVYKVRDIKSVPEAFRKAFPPSGGKTPPVLELAPARSPGSLEIPAWTFDRGNAEILASPDRYADAGPMAGGGSSGSGETSVEYDIDFPVSGEYTVQIRYSAAQARPADVWFDGKRVGKGCCGVTIGSSRFERPVKLSWSSRIARWEQLRDRGRLVRLSATKGKHTLRLSRRGGLPYLLAVRFSTQEAFAKGWKQSERKVKHIDRVPPRYRSVFLTPGAVNTAAFRLALADTVASFGAGYPRGREYLKQLSELEAKESAARNATPQAGPEVANALKALRREALLDHPELKFDKLLFLKRKVDGYGHTYSDQHRGDMAGGLCILSPVRPDGKVTKLIPELDGGLFDRFDLSYDAKRVVFSYRKNPKAGLRIYEVGVNPDTGVMVSGSLRQLTSGGGDEDAEAIERNKNRIMCVGREFDDMDPVYLPSGKIMFTSTRAMQVVFCAPGASVTNLFVMDADGKNLRRVSDSPVNETAPSVMDDGRVIYTRWEYVDKGLGNGQSLWAVRPDGTGVDHVYKNNTMWPAAMSNARSIPGCRKIVTVSGGHHFAAVGPVVIVDLRHSRRTTEAMNCITPELEYPTSMGYPHSKFGTFMDPYPFSEKFFLVSHRFGYFQYRRNRGDKNRTEPRYELYALDSWGNRAKLYGDPDIGCFEPLPLRPRRKPTEVSALETAGAKTGRAAMFIQDIYVGMKGIQRGRVKYVRVMGALPWPWNERGISWRLGHNADPHRKRIYGVAKVHEDGSAYFTVPAGENIFFQALDEDFMALQQMPSFINMMPGETRSCVGCHELRKKAPDLRTRPTAVKHKPQTLVPQPGDKGVRVVHYASDVQPVLNKHCVGCHSGAKPKGRLDLTGEPTRQWCRSYENLINKRLVSFADCRYGSSNFNAVPPLSRGSHLSKMIAHMRKGPCQTKITRAEFIRVATWIDANVPYYGTYRGKRDLRDKDCPDFRLPPLATGR
ncbi:MAG: hypothetical protein QGG42_00410 [Phycisphaerae bacterium]|jgi:hypothetical protein|nr:hypothetical protein [Phycisphaerae bacterium]